MIYFIYLLTFIFFTNLFSQWSLMMLIANSLGASSLVVSMIIGGAFLMKMVGSLTSGFFGDKYGEKLVSGIGLIGAGVFLISERLISTPGHWFLLSGFYGFFSGLILPAVITFLSKLTTQLELLKKMAFLGISVSLAVMFGPIYGHFISDRYGTDAVSSSFGLLFVWLGILAFVLLPAGEKTISLKWKAHIKNLLKRLGWGFDYGGALLLMYAMGNFVYLLLIKIDHLSSVFVGTIAITSLLVFVLPIDRIYQRFSRNQIIASGITILAVSLLFLGIFNLKTILIIGVILFSVSFASIFPLLLTLVSERTQSKERGRAYGLFFSLALFGFMTGIVMAVTFSYLALSLFVAAILLLLSSSLFWMAD